VDGNASSIFATISPNRGTPILHDFAQRIIPLIVAGDTEHTPDIFGLVHLIGGVAQLSQTIISAPPPGYNRRLMVDACCTVCRTAVDLCLNDQCGWNLLHHLCHHILATSLALLVAPLSFPKLLISAPPDIIVSHRGRVLHCVVRPTIYASTTNVDGIFCIISATISWPPYWWRRSAFPNYNQCAPGYHRLSWWPCCTIRPSIYASTTNVDGILSNISATISWPRCSHSLRLFSA
jgi:hypothetical protein